MELKVGEVVKMAYDVIVDEIIQEEGVVRLRWAHGSYNTSHSSQTILIPIEILPHLGVPIKKVFKQPTNESLKYDSETNIQYHHNRGNVLYTYELEDSFNKDGAYKVIRVNRVSGEKELISYRYAEPMWKIDKKIKGQVLHTKLKELRIISMFYSRVYRDNNVEPLHFKLTSFKPRQSVNELTQFEVRLLVKLNLRSSIEHHFFVISISKVKKDE